MSCIGPLGRDGSAFGLEAELSVHETTYQVGSISEGKTQVRVVAGSKVMLILWSVWLPGHEAGSSGVDELLVGPVAFIRVVLRYFHDVVVDAWLAQAGHGQLEDHLVDAAGGRRRGCLVHKETRSFKTEQPGGVLGIVHADPAYGALAHAFGPSKLFLGHGIVTHDAGREPLEEGLLGGLGQVLEGVSDEEVVDRGPMGLEVLAHVAQAGPGQGGGLALTAAGREQVGLGFTVNELVLNLVGFEVQGVRALFGHGGS